MREKLILPNIHIEKGRNSTEADNILHENHHFLRGYIKGCFDALPDGKEDIGYLSSNTGTLASGETGSSILEPLVG